jgi:hypothetical protein
MGDGWVLAKNKIKIMSEQSLYSLGYCNPGQLLLAESQRKSWLRQKISERGKGSP